MAAHCDKFSQQFGGTSIIDRKLKGGTHDTKQPFGGRNAEGGTVNHLVKPTRLKGGI